MLVLASADEPPKLEQSSTGRTYTRDAYAPVRRDAHAEVAKISAGSIPASFHFLISKSLSWTAVVNKTSQGHNKTSQGHISIINNYAREC